MEFLTHFKVNSRNEQQLISSQESDALEIHHIVYDVQCNTCQGQAFGHYLIYALEQDEHNSVPRMIRGFLRFQGTINGYKGSFLAFEDGAFHQSGLTLHGRIVDATEELMLSVGSYRYEPTDHEHTYDVRFVFDV